MYENYGITNEEYRALINNPSIKASEMMDRLILPERIYRYRRFGSICVDGTEKWIELKYWLEDIQGICKFSIPSEFNKNDNDDCKVYFDERIITNYMFKDSNREQRRRLFKESRNSLEKYKQSLQSKMRVGCFTTVPPCDDKMWNTSEFGDNGRGICFEYQFDRSFFCPDELSFLPVCYTNQNFDSTVVLKSVIDYCKNSDSKSASIMVCLGYGHTLIKPFRYNDEQEWRLVIPIREDRAHNHFFDVDNESKKDLTKVVKAIYLGPKFTELENNKEYKEAIIRKWCDSDINIYQIDSRGNYNSIN